MASHKGHIITNGSLFVREKEAARLLGVSHTTLKRWRQQHRIPYIDLRDLGTDRGVILYDPAALVKWAQQYSVEPDE